MIRAGDAAAERAKPEEDRPVQRVLRVILTSLLVGALACVAPQPQTPPSTAAEGPLAVPAPGPSVPARPGPASTAIEAAPEPPVAKRPPPPPPENPRLLSGRHAPSGLTRPPRPVRLSDGLYACKTDDFYRLRTCSVERDAEGRTWLEVHEGNLLPMRGLLEEDHGDLVFEGFPTEAAPFGCYACPETCGGEACGCNAVQELGARTCLQQAFHVRLRGGPGLRKGTLTHDVYFKSFDFSDGVRTLKAFDVTVNKYVLTIGRKLRPGEDPAPQKTR